MRHHFRCAMRWADMDAYGHVNNVVYLTYLEEARVDMLFTLGSEQRRQGALRGCPRRGGTRSTYKRPLIYHPRGVDIELWVGAIKGASFEIRYEVHDEDTLFARAASVLVALRPGRGAPAPGEPAGARLPRAVRRGRLSLIRRRRSVVGADQLAVLPPRAARGWPRAARPAAPGPPTAAATSSTGRTATPATAPAGRARPWRRAGCRCRARWRRP